MSDLIDKIESAVDQVQNAESVLAELAAVHALGLVVSDIEQQLAISALRGHSYGEVGRAVGLTRQGAHKRYGTTTADPS